VRQHELRSPWMARTLALERHAQAKAQTLVYNKRLMGLARQTSEGLAGVGTKYDVTEMAILLRAAHTYRALPEAAPEHQRQAGERAGKVLDAALRYDCKKVAELLSLQLPAPRTFGDGVPL
jgi:hypothetical protein